MALSGLPRGGGDGDAIRMGILHIMRENGIREGHRPVRTVGAQTQGKGQAYISACMTFLHPTWLRAAP